MNNNEVLSFEQERSLKLENVSDNFNYGDDVVIENMNGWEYLQPGDTYTRSVFINKDDCVDTVKATLVVVFESLTSTKVKESYVNW